ncbi:hypothetical protein LPJ66_008638 [Kickxella alabastrina]|uniref:Uncharacterized protein n=1 Tax=Kickxella alabastrina TaxID=61397 RepID=A0ACC1I810_9FUNG|nr:hypothetical protein LPJ66_008638 [Kickxella alabastrina]
MAIIRAIDSGINSPMRIKTSVKAVFGFLLALYTATGIAALAVSGYFLNNKNSSRRTIIITDNVLHSVMAAGIYVGVNVVVGIIGSLSPLTRKRWLSAYVWLAAIAILVETGMGIWLWSRTLNIDDLHGYNWRNLWSDDIKLIFQNEGKCCGYLSPLDSPVLNSATCENIQDAYGCMTAVNNYAHNYLTYVYTCMFCFVFVDVSAMLSGMVLLVIRNDEERWRWSRTNAIFKSMKKINTDSTVNDDMQAYALPKDAHYECS